MVLIQEIRWSSPQEIGWVRTEEIRWSSTEEIAWVRSQEILHRLDTRRKVLVGAIILDRVERGELAREELHAWLDRALTRVEDRALFDLQLPTEAVSPVTDR